MARRVVVDASAVLKLVLEEPGTETTRAWFERHWIAGTEFLAPATLHAEVGRVLQREYPTKEPAELQRAHADVLGSVGFIQPDVERPEPWIAAQHLEFFDALYVAAAMDADGLCTCDGRMAKAAASFDVPVVDPSQAS